jgi:AraC-like DNA-binding protein
LGIISSSIYVQQKSKSEENSLYYNSESLIKGIDYSLAYIRQYYVSLFSSSSCRWLDKENTAPYDKIQQVVSVQKLLTGESNQNFTTQNYYYINTKYRWMLSNNGLYPFTLVTNGDFLQSFLTEIESDKNVISWIDLPDEQNSKPVQSGYYDVGFGGRFLCLKRINALGCVEAILLIRLNDFLFDSVFKSTTHLRYNLGIISGGMQIFSDKKGIPLVGKTGRYGNYIVNSIDSDSSGFKYVIWQDISNIEKESDVFLFASLFVLAGFIAVILLVRFVYYLFTAPMKKMAAEIESRNIRDKARFFRMLLQASLSSEDIAAGIERWNLPRDVVFVYVLLLDKDKTQFDYASIEFPALLCPAVPVNNQFGAIIYGEDKESTEQLVSRFFELVRQRSGGSIIMGCSRIFTDLNKCRTAQNEAGEAFLNKAGTELSGSALFLFDDYLQTGYSRGIVDDTIENDLEKAVYDGDLQESEQIIELTLNRMEVRGLVGVDRSFYVSKILTIIFAAIIKCHLGVSEVFDPETYDKIMTRKDFNSTKIELKDFLLKDVIRPVVKRIRTLKTSGDSAVIQKVYVLISESQGNITLNECADIIRCHPNTITKALKAEKNTSFTEIVSNVKEKQAKYYLLTTDLPVNEVARHLGYANVQNFGRFFRERTGFSPLKYREMNFTSGVK